MVIPRLGLAFISSLLGKALGFIRLQAIAVLLGPTAVTDTLLLSLTVLSAFDSVFISGSAILFIQAVYLRRQVRGAATAAAVRVARSAALWSYLAAVFGMATAVLARPLADLLAPGFSRQADELFSQLCIVGAAIPAASTCMVYLSALNRMNRREVLYTINPVIINGASLLAIFAAAHASLSGMQTAVALVLVVLASTLAMVAFQAGRLPRRELELIAAAFARALVPTRFWSKIRYHLRELTAIGPIVATLLLQQALVFVSYSFASKLGQGSLTTIGLADRLVNVVFSLFVATFLTVLEPRWARKLAQPGSLKSAGLGDDMLVMGLLLLPVTATLIFCGEDIVHLLFGYGAYAGSAASELGTTLRVYSMALPGLSLALIFSRVIIISGHSARLTAVNLLLLITHFTLCRTLSGRFGLEAIAISFVATMTLQAVAYRWILGARLLDGLGRFASARIVLLAIVCAAVSFLIQRALGEPLLRVVLVVVAATATTLLGAMVLRLPLLASGRRLMRL